MFLCNVCEKSLPLMDWLFFRNALTSQPLVQIVSNLTSLMLQIKVIKQLQNLDSYKQQL